MSERPKIVPSKTTRKVTGCGHLYVTVGEDGAEPCEVFAHLGKAGGCANCFLEALTRVITVGLNWGIPVEVFVKELEGLRCPNSCLYPEEEGTLSCPDGIARVLDEKNT